MMDLKQHLSRILTPELCLTVYRLKYPYGKGQLPSGAVVGRSHFRPEDFQAFYDLVFRSALMPMSRLPLDALLNVDLTELLPAPTAPNYPEQCLGMVTILDQQRVLTTGYSFRYTRAYFDPICEKLARELIALPEDVRPDGKEAWLSRGYTFDDYLTRTLWFWAPLVHSDEFMVHDRRSLKDWLHAVRSEVEVHSGVADPFAALEADDDVDVTAFQRIEGEGPPQRSCSDPDSEATVSDYTFWWIRILNSHFAITDVCGHYPYWIRWKGREWTEADKEFMKSTSNYRYDPTIETILQEVRKDYLDGVWKLLQPNPKYERKEQMNGAAFGNPVLRETTLSEQEHEPRVRPTGSSRMPP